MPGPKEAIYDAEIAPLMKRIIATCKAHGINAAATFVLDPDEDSGSALRCTTVLPVDKSDEEGHAHILKLREVMCPPKPQLFAFTIMTGAKP